MNWRLRVFSATDNRLFLVGQSSPCDRSGSSDICVFALAAISLAVFHDASSIDSYILLAFGLPVDLFLV